MAGAAWTGWHYGGGLVGSDPLCASTGGKIFATVKDPWGSIYYRPFTEGPGNNWGAWVTTGGSLSGMAPAGAEVVGAKRKGSA